MSQQTDKDSPASFSSELSTGAERFLSRVAQHALKNAWQTPEGFVRHFGPTQLMQALAHADKLRARMLVELANVHERIAAKKSLDSAIEDIRLALEEGITTPQAVVECFAADDQVRYLKASTLWSCLFEELFFRFGPTDEEAKQRAIGRMAFLLDCAIEENLLSLKQFADGVGFEVMAEHLPSAELQRIVVSALQGGRQKQPLTEERLLELIPFPKLLGFLPLEVVWSRVIIERVAKTSGFVDAGPESPVSAPPSTRGTSRPGPSSAAPPAPDSRPKSGIKKEEKSSPQVDVEVEESELLVSAVDSAVSSNSAGVDDEVRSGVIDRLRELERLPTRHADLSTPVLLSVESMYADLLQATTDEERSDCIRESFPNDAHLRTAMLALAELLEPSIDVTRPPISDADTDALVKLVVFEERKRKEGDSAVRKSSGRPPPLPMGRSASSVPAAARAPLPMPTLPGSKNNRD
jgi:hypothetical protein